MRQGVPERREGQRKARGPSDGEEEQHPSHLGKDRGGDPDLLLRFLIWGIGAREIKGACEKESWDSARGGAEAEKWPC